MREIKFRVWDSERKRIWPIQRHSFKTGKSMPYGWNVEYVFDELMQYTGLKDKNGTEIYEGDIVFDSHCEENGKVIFDEGCFAIEWETTIEDLFENCDIYEVIGNAYQNPELLKEGE